MREDIIEAVDVTTAIRAWLDTLGAEGLAGDDCGCDRDDLFPCGCMEGTRCRPADFVPCDECNRRDTDECGGDGEGGCYFARDTITRIIEEAKHDD